MSPLRAHVEKGRLVLDEPTTLPEGTVVDLVADDEGDDLTDDERARTTRGAVRVVGIGDGRSSSTSVRDFGRAAPAPVSLPVRTTPEADAQILEIDSWWRRNRHASPDLFADELAASFDILSRAPNIGRYIGLRLWLAPVDSWAKTRTATGSWTLEHCSQSKRPADH